MKSYKEFYNTYNNTKVDVDKAYGNQCYDLAQEYYRYLYGVLSPWSAIGAIDFWKLRDVKFAGRDVEYLHEPRIGAWVVYDSTSGGGVQDPYGHIGIVNDLNGGVFQQNYNCPNADCPATVHNMSRLKPIGYILPKIIEEYGTQQQTDTPQPIEVPQPSPSLQRRNFKSLEGIRGRTAPNFDNNIYTQFNGIGKSINQLEIVDGAEYQGSNKWVKFRYADLQLDNRADIDIYSHSSFFE